ncbi:MAG: hypothetical protein LOD87_12815, partial [Planifilum fulgidum]
MGNPQSVQFHDTCLDIPHISDASQKYGPQRPAQKISGIKPLPPFEKGRKSTGIISLIGYNLQFSV